MINSKQILDNYSFLLLYQGNFSDPPTYNLSVIVENSLRKFYSKKITKKLVYLIIEMAQNIERYSEHSHKEKDLTLTYGTDKAFYVVTENVISAGAMSKLDKRFSELKDKHKEQLNEVFRSVMNRAEGTEKGAGLGLIDIARKTNNTLTHHFLPLGNGLYKFQFRIELPLNADVQLDSSPKDIVPDEIRNMTENNDSTLVYSGDFSNDFLSLLIEMLDDVKQGKQSDNTLFRHSLIEMVQNIRRHGKLIDNIRPGFIRLEWRKKIVGLTGANIVSTENAPEIKTYIDLLNGFSQEELERLSEEKMLDFESEGGLGLIHISSFIKPGKLLYDFVPYDDQHQVYLLESIFES